MPYDDRNKGAMFPNDRKRTDNDRDHNGTLAIECPHCNKTSDWWISAWDNISRAGNAYKSLVLQWKDAPKNPKPEPSGESEVGNRGTNPDGTTKPPPRDGDTPVDDGFDDIPF